MNRPTLRDPRAEQKCLWSSWKLQEILSISRDVHLFCVNYKMLDLKQEWIERDLTINAAKRRGAITKAGIDAFAVPTCSLEKEKGKKINGNASFSQELKITRQPIGRHSWYAGLLLPSRLNG